MTPSDSFVLLMFIAVLLVAAAYKIRVPYPVILVIGGAVCGFIPGIALFSFDPNILLKIVLPPILFHASYALPYKEFIRYLRDILAAGFWLVLLTAAVVALLFKWLFPDLPWALAFAFGALISPPDATAATSTLKRFSISSRLRTILEGESLINDATALVIYRFAVLALLTGSFSLSEVSIQILYVAGAGILIGLIAGYLLNKIASYLHPVVSVVLSFVIPYLTYFLADYLGASGVLAVVACGLLGARMLIPYFTPLTRVLAWTSWDIFTILLNCFIFILIGLEFRLIVGKMPLHEIWVLAWYGALLTAAIVLTRYLWIYCRRGLFHYKVRKDPSRVQQSKVYLLHAAIAGWAGMRGIVSLTAALALPLTLANGALLEGRDIVLFLTFEIIVLTLILPGLTLPWLIRALKIQPVNCESEMAQARKNLAQVARDKIQNLHALRELEDEERDLLLAYFDSRHRIMEVFSLSEEHKIEVARHLVLQRQRDHLQEMWKDEKINEMLMSYLERELDIEEAHLANRESS